MVGAASGIGASVVRELVGLGARVVGVDVSAEINGLTASLSTGELAGVCGDVTDPNTMARAIDCARKLGGSLSILVYSPFAEVPEPLEATTPEAWGRTLDVLLTTAWKTDVEFVGSLDGPTGSIIHVASVHAMATASRYGAYATAKAGLLGLTRAAAIEWGPRGVRVNAVCPGFIRVKRNAFLWGNAVAVDSLLRCYPLGRLGEPEDVGRAVGFLCSPAASFTTGVALPVDGGMLTLVPEAVAVEQ